MTAILKIFDKLIWLFSYLRQRARESKRWRSFFILFINFWLACEINIFTAAHLHLFPSDIDSFAVLWKTDGFKGVWTIFLLQVLAVIFFPAENEISDAERNFNKKIYEKLGEHLDATKSADEVLDIRSKVKKGRKK